MADIVRDLAVVIRLRFPVVQIETREEIRMMKLLERVSNQP
jgi:cell fate regulator YaaT (PSP1 superfamily)